MNSHPTQKEKEKTYHIDVSSLFYYGFVAILSQFYHTYFCVSKTTFVAL